ncbi:MAG TPA: carboxypeptidase-like regulatory domain-containing protein, partial [Puia sp.]
MKKLPLLVLLVFGLSIHGFTQNRLIKGKVTDDHGKPLAGASINIKNTTVTTSTDLEGNFQIPLPAQAKPVLVVTFVGYVNTELPVGGSNFVNVQLLNNAQSLNDVIVVGYGTQRKKDVTGAISVVKADEIQKRPLVRVEQALQGTTPGVAVQ